MQKTNRATAELSSNGGYGAGMQAKSEDLRICISCSFAERCSVGEKNHKLEEFVVSLNGEAGKVRPPEMCPSFLFFFFFNKIKTT